MTATTLTPRALTPATQSYVNDKWDEAKYCLLIERPLLAMQYAKIARYTGNLSTLRPALWEQITDAVAIERTMVLSAVLAEEWLTPSVIGRKALVPTTDARAHLESLARCNLVAVDGARSRRRYRLPLVPDEVGQ